MAVRNFSWKSGFLTVGRRRKFHSDQFETCFVMNGKECHTNMSKNCNEKLNEPSFWVLDPVWPSFGGGAKKRVFFLCRGRAMFFGHVFSAMFILWSRFLSCFWRVFWLFENSNWNFTYFVNFFWKIFWWYLHMNENLYSLMKNLWNSWKIYEKFIFCHEKFFLWIFLWNLWILFFYFFIFEVWSCFCVKKFEFWK